MAFRELGTRLFEASLPNPESVDWQRTVAPASADTLGTFHTEAYVQSVERSAHLGSRVWLDAGDTPSFPGCDEAAARVVEGTVNAVEAAIARGGPTFHPFGGLHHAHPDRASGFCIYNDVALGVRTAVERVGKVAYIDIDAHHGDGVMYGFYDSGKVLDIDFHQDGRTLFPGTGSVTEHGGGDGAGLKVNLPLPPGAGDRALISLFERIVPPLLKEFRPEVIILQHGVDGHAGDPLAQLQFTPHGYAAVVSRLLRLSSELAHGRLVVTGGGGYDPVNVSLALARTGRLLAGEPAVPAPGAETPAVWRSEFLRQVEQSAPLSWDAPPGLTFDPWNRQREDALVQALSTTLGRKFPSPR
jgi:acetoin utilization protein AcuC